MFFATNKTPTEESTEVVLDYFSETYTIVPGSDISDDFIPVSVFKNTKRFKVEVESGLSFEPAYSKWMDLEVCNDKEVLKRIRNGTTKRLWVKEPKNNMRSQIQDV